MLENDRLIVAESIGNEEVIDHAIRPTRLADYVGQPAVREQMEIFISAARTRKEALDHVLIFGQAWGSWNGCGLPFAIATACERGCLRAKPTRRSLRLGKTWQEGRRAGTLLVAAE